MSEKTVSRRRLRVGLLISNPEDEFDNAVCEGAMIAAQHFDVDMFILPGRYIDAQYADKIRTAYEYQYNILISVLIGAFTPAANTSASSFFPTILP